METRYFTIDQLQEAGEFIRLGKLIAFPTETVYGLGGNAMDPLASQAIYAAKGRPSDNPLIVHISTLDQLSQIVSTIDPVSQLLAEAFWPGPLTLVLPKHPQVPQQTSGGLGTLGVRIPDDPIGLEFLKWAGVPVAAPSANLSGRPSPTSFSMVKQDLDGRIHGIIQGTDTRIGLESTILWVADQRVHILRPGAIGPKEIHQVLTSHGMDRVEILNQWDLRSGNIQSPNQNPNLPAAPGTKYRHYSPKATIKVYHPGSDWFTFLEPDHAMPHQVYGLVYLLGPHANSEAELSKMMNTLALDYGMSVDLITPRLVVSGTDGSSVSHGLKPKIYVLPIRSIDQYAQEFYRSLVDFDQVGVQTIFLPFPDKSEGGLADALIDRILRAAGLTSVPKN